MQTVPGKGWNTILRLYGPLECQQRFVAGRFGGGWLGNPRWVDGGKDGRGVIMLEG